MKLFIFAYKQQQKHSYTYYYGDNRRSSSLFIIIYLLFMMGISWCLLLITHAFSTCLFNLELFSLWYIFMYHINVVCIKILFRFLTLLLFLCFVLSGFEVRFFTAINVCEKCNNDERGFNEEALTWSNYLTQHTTK